MPNTTPKKIKLTLPMKEVLAELKKNRDIKFYRFGGRSFYTNPTEEFSATIFSQLLKKGIIEGTESDNFSTTYTLTELGKSL